jgi:hypothetical protein
MNARQIHANVKWMWPVVKGALNPPYDLRKVLVVRSLGPDKACVVDLCDDMGEGKVFDMTIESASFPGNDLTARRKLFALLFHEGGHMIMDGPEDALMHYLEDEYDKQVEDIVETGCNMAERTAYYFLTHTVNL